MTFVLIDIPNFVWPLAHLTIPTDSDPFSDVEQKITLKFNQLIEAVIRKREQLLAELRALEEQHKDGNLEIVNQIKELEISKNELAQYCIFRGRYP